MSRNRLAVCAALVSVAMGLVLASGAAAQEDPPFGIVPGSFSAGAHRPGGADETQAAVHPFEASTSFDLTIRGDGYPVGRLRDLRMELPPGFSGDPLAVTKCPRRDFTNMMLWPSNPGPGCPADSQVGIAIIDDRSWGEPGPNTVPVYLLEAPDGKVAQLGLPVFLVPVTIDIGVDTAGDFNVVAEGNRTSQGIILGGAKVTLWGYPNDSSHDFERFCGQVPAGGLPAQPCPVDVPNRPFLTNPSSCATPRTVLSVNSWEEPSVWASAFADAPAVTGCGRLSFTPSIDVSTSSGAAGSPSGLSVDLRLPQADDPQTGLAPPPLRDAKITLPEGMTINPSSADGLEACSDEQLGLGTDDPIACPDGSKIGTVRAETPVLEQPLTGGVYLRSQASQDPESGEMFRLALVVENKQRGLLVKLDGQVRADAETGRLETTFTDNPQLPVSRVLVELKTGPRAPLALPQDCGSKTVDARLSSWAGQTVDVADGFDVACPGESRFEPSFEAGALSLTGGEFSPLVASIARPDGQRYLSGVKLDLPEGLIAKLEGVPLCGGVQAEQGGCPAGSRIGSTTVAAGAGPNPFHVAGDLYLTEGYKGGPYGVAAHVHAKAGPFDLGWVRLRQALYVDPVTAKIAVVSDPLPQIVKGVPVRLRDVDVDVDRSKFTINPTSCAPKSIDATLTSIDGVARDASSRFQAADCQALAFKPKLAMRLSGKKQRRTGGHPGLRAVLTQAGGQANAAAAKVTLPKSVVLDAKNSYDPKLVCDYDAALKADCPASSVIGSATARTPVLNKPLAGDVHLVQGIKFGSKGNRIRTTPTLLVKLRGEVAIDLRAKTTVDKSSRLVTTFARVPDAPVSKFTLNVKGGKKGILVVTRTRKAKIDICASRQVADVETDGQNGKRADFSTRVKTPCGKAAKLRLMDR